MYTPYFLTITMEKDGNLERKVSGKIALELIKKRRLELSRNDYTPTPQDARDEETIKRNQVSLNVEGVTSMYVDDLKPFADHLKGLNFDAESS